MNMEDFKSEIIEEVKKYSGSEWYNLFLALFFNCSNEEMDELHTNILNSLNDAFAIVSTKKRYEYNEIHKRIW